MRCSQERTEPRIYQRPACPVDQADLPLFSEQANLELTANVTNSSKTDKSLIKSQISCLAPLDARHGAHQAEPDKESDFCDPPTDVRHISDS